MAAQCNHDSDGSMPSRTFRVFCLLHELDIEFTSSTLLLCLDSYHEFLPVCRHSYLCPQNADNEKLYKFVIYSMFFNIL